MNDQNWKKCGNKFDRLDQISLNISASVR